MIVTGVGTRDPIVTQDLTDIMRVFCSWASARGAILRSGSAVGMDSWFERLWRGPKEIYIPQDVYKPDRNSSKRRYNGVDGAINVIDPNILAQATKIAKRIHPAWNAMGTMGKALHTRNVFQVLGQYLDSPSNIIVYFAKFDNTGIGISGGTRTAVELAREYNILEFNLILPDDIDRLLDYMNESDENKHD